MGDLDRGGVSGQSTPTDVRAVLFQLLEDCVTKMIGRGGTRQVAREKRVVITATKEIGVQRKKFFLAPINAVPIPVDGLTSGVKGGWWQLQGKAADAWRETFDDCSSKPQSLAGFIKTMVKQGVLVTRNVGTTVLYAPARKKMSIKATSPKKRVACPHCGRRLEKRQRTKRNENLPGGLM